MPVHCAIEIENLSAEEFEKLDYRVMGHAYASQNELGRLCDECAYQADLKDRLLTDGFRSVDCEVPLTVTHGSFSKTYFLDLVVGDAVYELKTAAALANDHQTQLFNYIFLLGVQRGKLLNFRPSKVEGKLLATGLAPEERARFTLSSEFWHELTPNCLTLRRFMTELLQDWGAFLDFALYREALAHLLGGTGVEQQIILRRDGLSLGAQRMLLHAPEVAFRITACTENQNYFESNLRRLLSLTDLKAIQWINLNHAQIEFKTIQR